MRLACLLILLFTVPLAAQFESRPAHPLTISADGSRLYAVNGAEARLSVFAVGPASHPDPLLIAEVPVGLCPVSVRLRTATEAWVVCELSDAITIVDLTTNTVAGTIATGDEPADVAFVGSHAYVTCSRDNSVEVYSTTTQALVDTIPLEGLFPRSIAVSPDNLTLHVAFLHSGNGTTILPRDEAPPQPAPTNPALPAPPQVGLIVPVDDPGIPYDVVNHDLAHVSVSDYAVTYTGDVGTNLFVVHPLPSGELLVPHTEARNLIRFEPELKARFIRNRLARFTPSTSALVQVPLDVDPDTIPPVDPAAAAIALAQPMAVTSTGTTAYLAAFGSDRIGVLDLTTNTLATPIDLRSPDAPAAPRGPLTVRGPRGLALHPSLSRLYCYNKLSHTLSVIDTTGPTVISEVPLSSFPDLPDDLKTGRGFLSDARLSGNGSVSCASCHIDMERDGIAWDLGDPGGEMQVVSGTLNSVHAYTTWVDYDLHPMKGPMITQTLFGLVEQTKLHWRGDRPSIQSFNPTFEKLLAGSQLAAADMDKVADYLLTLRHHPNPNLELDGDLPTSFNGTNPAFGEFVFVQFDNHCRECHQFPAGSTNNHDLPSQVGSFQAIKDPPLRTTFHRAHFDNTPGATSLSGFGLLSDGSGSLVEHPIVHPYSLHILDDESRPLAQREAEKAALAAYLLCFDTGTAPAVGHSVMLDYATTAGSPERITLATLESQASTPVPAAGVVLRGTFQGQPRSFRYQPATSDYTCDSSTIADTTIDSLIAQMAPGDCLLATGVPVGQEDRLSVDRDEDGFADALVSPPLQISAPQTVAWPEAPGWYPESSQDLFFWLPDTRTQTPAGGLLELAPAPSQHSSYTRLRRTW